MGAFRKKGLPSLPVRPATILGEFGEGYCAACMFIEPLGEDGRIVRHFTGRHAVQFGHPGPEECPGSCRKPPARTPRTAEAARFTTTPRRMVMCPLCMRMLYKPANGFWPVHSMPTGRSSECTASHMSLLSVRPLS